MSLLYAIPAEFGGVVERFEELSFEEVPEAQASIALSGDVNAVAMKHEDKVRALVYWRENILAEAEILDAEANRLKAKRDAKRRAADGIKRFVADFMRVMNLSKFSTDVRSLHFRKGSTSVFVDESQVESWAPDFFDAAVKCGALVPRYEVKVSLLKTLPGYLEQPGVEQRTGEETLVIK